MIKVNNCSQCKTSPVCQLERCEACYKRLEKTATSYMVWQYYNKCKQQARDIIERVRREESLET